MLNCELLETVPHAGDAVQWGLGFKTRSAAECCLKCQELDKRAKCNIWWVLHCNLHTAFWVLAAEFRPKLKCLSKAGMHVVPLIEASLAQESFRAQAQQAKRMRSQSLMCVQPPKPCKAWRVTHILTSFSLAAVHDVVISQPCKISFLLHDTRACCAGCGAGTLLGCAGPWM